MRGDLQINFKLLHNLILHVQCCIHIFGKALCLRGNLRKFLACAEIFQMPRTIPALFWERQSWSNSLSYIGHSTHRVLNTQGDCVVLSNRPLESPADDVSRSFNPSSGSGRKWRRPPRHAGLMWLTGEGGQGIRGAQRSYTTCQLTTVTQPHSQ